MWQPQPERSPPVEFDVEEGLSASWDEARLSQLVRGIVARELQQTDYTISVHLVGDETIRALNASTAAKTRTPTCCRFRCTTQAGCASCLPPDQPANLGDVVVSYPRAWPRPRSSATHPTASWATWSHTACCTCSATTTRRKNRPARMRQREEEALGAVGLTR